MDEAEFCDRLVLIYQGRLIAQGTPRELKAQVPEEIIAVFPDRLGEALEVIRKLPQVAEAAVFGDGLHVATTQAAAAETAMKEALATEGIAIRRLGRVEPSLEDAFISLIERAGNAE
jgi:ABC-2 type transport system ATP-binding protein